MDLLRTREVFELVHARSRASCSATAFRLVQVGGRTGNKHLAAVADGQQSRDAVERRAEVIAIALLAWPGVQRHAHAHTVNVEKFSVPSARCASSAAAIASGAVENAAQKASPIVLKTSPPRLSIAARISES